MIERLSSVAWPADLSRYDAVVHLAGANLFAKRWSAAYKAEIRASRVESTRRLVEAIAASPKRPKVLVSGSAIGIYGDKGERPLPESATTASEIGRASCRERV